MAIWNRHAEESLDPPILIARALASCVLIDCLPRGSGAGATVPCDVLIRDFNIHSERVEDRRMEAFADGFLSELNPSFLRLPLARRQKRSNF